MTRLCERPGCSEPAHASFGIDQANLVVWLDRYGGPLAARAGVLCERHADAMVVPIGWMLDDRREPVPRLFRSPAAADTASGGIRRRPRSARPVPDDDTEQLRFDAEAVAAIPDDPPASVPVLAPAAAEQAALPIDPVPDDESAADGAGPADAVAPWAPVFDQADDLRGLLRPRGSLLSRAFNGTPRPAD